MKRSIFKENKRYTFSDYFDMTAPTDEIVAEFGYTFGVEMLQLPQLADPNPVAVQRLNELYYAILPRISLNSEMAKREFLIAPLILEIARNTTAKINVEYLLDVSDKLSGSLDYLLRSTQELIVIEAKKKDVDSGFNQLAAEMIALDKYHDDGANMLYGAVTLGDIWKFGTLDRERKHIAKHIRTHTIPDDTAEVFAILMGIVG
ncbi:hypothetical protein [Thiothrix sp.]|jgi:hypothetical protein|uniref:hypothetical protein n=1 Tax=Thiothrix sp. TaxID=1032 RepID=UPI00257CB08E|nr:hypothetical protein [Thiothrix sp.]